MRRISRGPLAERVYLEYLPTALGWQSFGGCMIKEGEPRQRGLGVQRQLTALGCAAYCPLLAGSRCHERLLPGCEMLGVEAWLSVSLGAPRRAAEGRAAPATTWLPMAAAPRRADGQAVNVRNASHRRPSSPSSRCLWTATSSRLGCPRRAAPTCRLKDRVAATSQERSTVV